MFAINKKTFKLEEVIINIMVPDGKAYRYSPLIPEHMNSQTFAEYYWNIAHLRSKNKLTQLYICSKIKHVE